MIQYDGNTEDAEEVKSFVKFRNRTDKLIAKVIEKQDNRLTEKFDMGRPDRLEELLYINHMASNATGEQIKIYKFYHKSRKDGLSTRESRDWGKCFYVLIFRGTSGISVSFTESIIVITSIIKYVQCHSFQSRKQLYDRKCPSVCPSVTETPQPLRIAPIGHRAYQPLSLLTIEPIDH